MRTKDEADVATRVIDRSTATAEVLFRETPPSERRLKPRFEVALHVTLVGDHNFYVGLTQNFSEGGLFVHTEHTLPIGSTVRVEFSLPTSTEKLSAVGQVRWVRSPNAVASEHDNFSSGDDKSGMGVKFMAMSETTFRAIAKFIAMRNPEFYAE